MKSASKPTKPLTWGQIYKGAERLDERHDTEAYTTAVLMRMLQQVCGKRSPKKVYFLAPRPRGRGMTVKR